MLVKNVKSHNKVNFLNPKSLVLIVGNLANFKLLCGANHINKEAAMWDLPHFVHETPTNAINSLIYAINSIAPFAASVRNREKRSQKQSRSYPKVGNYLFEKFARNQTIAEYDTSILRYVKPLSMSTQNCAEDIIAKLCKEAEAYDESTRNDVYIKVVDSSI